MLLEESVASERMCYSMSLLLPQTVLLCYEMKTRVPLRFGSVCCRQRAQVKMRLRLCPTFRPENHEAANE